MKNKINIILLLLFLIIAQLSVLKCNDNKFIDSLIKKYPINKNEFIGIAFLDYGSCVKCYNYPKNLFKNIQKFFPYNIKIIAFINCNRVKEINNFAQKFDWEYFVEPDINHKARSDFGCNKDTDICIINNKGEIIAELSNETNYNTNLNLLKEVFSKYK